MDINQFNVNISFDKEKFDKTMKDVLVKYDLMPLNEETIKNIKEELKQGACDAINISW